jgi:NAD(P)-dependent dehydrogenase (short-subunit alcohol dehydrogenase family)
VSWDPRRLPSQAGKTIVVTGAGRGVGYFVAEQLAAAGARVIMTTRTKADADAAAAALRAEVPSAQLEFVTLDLASLASIRTAAKELAQLGPIDVLINNAGKTSGAKRRETTADGLEIMVGTNAYGPFALTALVFPALAPTARIVSLGSLATRLTRADLADLEQKTGAYSVSKAYAYSKHAVHAFAFELDRRLRDAGGGIESLLAHPGFALDGSAPRRAGVTDRSSAGQRFVERLMRPMAHGKNRGAWPVVRAAIDPQAQGGQFYGPARSVTGPPVITKPVAQSLGAEFGAEFWRLAEEATGVRFEIPASSHPRSD